MEGFTESRKPLASVGRETRSRKPMDNIDLDMEDAERLGYGCQYGRFKADHPHTKEANEARLAARKKRQKQTGKRYEKVCPVCGETFIAKTDMRIYCDDTCKRKKDDQRETPAARSEPGGKK